MKYIDEYRDRRLIEEVSARIKNISGERPLKFMEVCGTHTQAFRRFGLDKLMPQNVKLISGPGCPVCVSHQDYIDKSIALAREENTIILTFGDMLRIPGSTSTLEEENARQGNVHVVYSAMDTLSMAGRYPGKRIVFLAVGFETTAPTIALSLLAAKNAGLKNLFFFSSLKLIPPAMKLLVEDKRLKINGFLCPGHVSAIIGSAPYQFIPRRYGIPCCIAGFEPLDILKGIYNLIAQIKRDKAVVANEYSRVVKDKGNLKAREITARVFRVVDEDWRGFGRIPDSGLKIRSGYESFDAEKKFMPKAASGKEDARLKKCRCGLVLKGLISPDQCPLFARICNPLNPIGPCMVSYEGACNAYYKYKK